MSAETAQTVSWVRDPALPPSILIYPHTSSLIEAAPDGSLAHAAHEPQRRVPDVRSRFGDVRRSRRAHVRVAFIPFLSSKNLTGFSFYPFRFCSFVVMGLYSWRSDVNSFPELDSQIVNGPTWVHEYSTREAYGANITWGANDPLNATWWHLVTEGPFIIDRTRSISHS